MNIVFYPPPDYLKSYIRYFWSCEMVGYQSEKMIFFDNYADKYPRLVFQVDDRPQLRNNDNHHVPNAYICGIETVASSMSIESNFSHFGISFNSFGLAEIFKIGNETLVDQIIDLNDLGLTDLISKLADAISTNSRMEIMCKFIANQISQKKIVNNTIVQIVLNGELVEKTDLFKLQKKYKLTERTMERQFKNALGISPKTFQRLVRFEKSLHLLKNPIYQNSAAIGYILNYTDQSHFIKDFKRFTNITPSQFQKNHFLLSESSAFISKK